jgi:hypothetical protein
MTVNVADQIPDNLDRCVNPRLLATIGHVASLGG